MAGENADMDSILLLPSPSQVQLAGEMDMCSTEDRPLRFASGLCYAVITNGFGLAPPCVGQTRLVSCCAKESPFKLLADFIKNVLVKGAGLPYEAGL